VNLIPRRFTQASPKISASALKNTIPANPPHTRQYKPWILETYLAFSDRNQAQDFERYLKTGSGIAFASKRLRHFAAPGGKKRTPFRPPQL